MSTNETLLKDVLQQFGPMLARIAASYEADRALREDLLQEIALALWKALPSFREEATLKTFVARVAQNRAVDHILQRKRIHDRHATDDDVADMANPQSRALHERMDLATAIRRLPLSYRQCIELMLEGFSQAEIGATLNLAEANVAQRLGRGRRQLAELLNTERAR